MAPGLVSKDANYHDRLTASCPRCTQTAHCETRCRASFPKNLNAPLPNRHFAIFKDVTSARNVLRFSQRPATRAFTRVPRALAVVFAEFIVARIVKRKREV